MPTLIRFENIHKAYNGRVLLEDASLSLNDKQKVGLVGKNGCGKSTLCRILLGLEDADSGTVALHDNLRISYLKQHDDYLETETVLEYLQRISGNEAWKCAEVAYKFAITEYMMGQLVTSLSGGYRTRAKLTGMLLEEPNFILLDEPTNFLDLRTQMLLEEFLLDFNGGVLVVSHDTNFLDNICDTTIAIENKLINMYPSSITAYFEANKLKREHQAKSNVGIATKKKQLQKFINTNRANANTAAQARNKQKQLDRLTEEEIQEEDRTKIQLKFAEPERRTGVVVSCDDLKIGYPDFTVANDVNIEIEHGEKVAVLGDNGQGKTTLIRTISDDIEKLAGNYKWGYGTKIAVYAQHVYTSISDTDTVDSYLLKTAVAGTKTPYIQSVAGSFLFSGDEYYKPISVLSGGERARLCLAGMFLSMPNVLILDEPTNHLDVESVQSLANALVDFKGTVIFVSHDRGFIKKIATKILEVMNKSISVYPGKYDDWEYRVHKEIEEGSRVTKKEKVEEKVKTKAFGKIKYELEKKEKALNRKISKLENEVKKAIEKAKDDHGAELANTSKKLELAEDDLLEVLAELEEL